MANLIQIKRASDFETSENPVAYTLAEGELAFNNNGKKLWIGRRISNTGNQQVENMRVNPTIVGTTNEIDVTASAAASGTSAGDTLTLGLPDAITISGAATVGSVSTSGAVSSASLTTTSSVTCGNDLSVGGDITVTGDLTVNGNTITANVATITIEDKTIELGKVDNTTDALVSGSGIITTGTASDVKSILYSSTNDRWVSNKRFDAPTFVGDLTGDVTGDVTGTAANVTGTVAIANGGTGAVNAGAARTALGVDAAGTDNSTNVTLATVTSNYLSLSGQAITAGTIPVALGGTGATTVGAARTALGVDAAGTINYVHPNHSGDVTSTADGATAIASGVIVDADVKSDAAIAYSKLGTIPTWDQDTTGNAATVTNGLYTSSTIDGGTF